MIKPLTACIATIGSIGQRGRVQEAALADEGGAGAPTRGSHSSTAIPSTRRTLSAVVAALAVAITTGGYVYIDAFLLRAGWGTDQLNIATFALVQNVPDVLAHDFTFGVNDPSRFYTPWQVEVAWQLWQATGSPEGAFAAQLPALVVLSFALAGGSVYWLTRSLVASLVAAASATAFRPEWLGADIWGVGPFYSILPRTWAGPLVFVALALWLLSRTRRDGRLLALAGLTCGLMVNLHPPTGAVTAGALLLAALVDLLLDRRETPYPWRWWLLSSGGFALGAAPFLANYVGTIAAQVPPDDYDAYLAAARYRLGKWIWPGLLQEIWSWLHIQPGAFGRMAFVAVAILGVLAVRRHVPSSHHLRPLLLFTGGLIVASVVVPIVLQVILIELRLSPVSTIDLVRGLRLVVPVSVLLAGLAIASLLGKGFLRSFLAFALAFLVLMSAYAPSIIAEIPAGMAPLAGLLVGLAAAVGLAWAIAPRLAARRWPAWTPGVLVVALTVLFPIWSLDRNLAWDAATSGAVPAAANSADAIQEMLDWAQDLPADRVIEASAVSDGIAMRLRLEAERGLTGIWKDGGVLVYADPERAIEWHQRRLVREEATRAGDFEAFRAAAAEAGASIIVIVPEAWKGPLPEQRGLWRNQWFSAFPTRIAGE